jgi:NADH:ubiquinone oxidoreductase subunit 5 (subunit L)/multisubunit Na+/H+ antiporter MnhA subunit
MKLIHAVFLGQPSNAEEEMKQKFNEVGWPMLLPLIILAVLCVVFGIFAFPLALKQIILPSIAQLAIGLPAFQGLWQAEMATILVIAGLLLGIIVYVFSRIKTREDHAFIGGEELPLEERITGTDFYRTVSDIGFFARFYRAAEKKLFDAYDIGTKFVLGIGKLLSGFHSGNLRTYVFWMLLGFTLLFIYFIVF